MWPLLLAAAAAPGATQVQVEADRRDIIVTATRTAGLADTAPYPLIVLDEPVLAARTSVADALADVPEVYVQAPGGRSGTAALFVRGGDPNFTAVLLDGVPLNNPANVLGGAVNASEYGSAAFERVEVVAGPFSSVYGSGALAGVMNLVVPGGTADTRGEVRAGIGTSLDRSLFLRLRGPLGSTTGGSLAVSLDDDGDTAQPSRFRSVAMLGKIAASDAGDTDRLVFRAARTNSRAFPDASGGERLAVLRTLELRESDEFVAGATKTLASGRAARIEVSGSLLARRDQVETPGVSATSTDTFGVPGGVDTTRYRRATAQIVGRYGANGWQGVAGIEVQHELAVSEGALSLFGLALPSGFRGSRGSTAAFAEASWTTAALVVNGGARVDRIEGLGTHATGRLGARYRIGDTGVALHGSVANGFKAPSFYALGNPFVGNPSLRPERSLAVEAGIAWTTDQSSASVTVFRTRYIDLIDFVPDPVPRLENRARSVTRGISLAARHQVGESLRLTASGQILRASVEGTGERLLNRPRWRTSATANWTLASRLTLSARATVVGERLSFSVPTGVVTLGAYTGVAIDATWTAPAGPSFRLVLDNVLDGENEDAVGFTAPGRRARVLVTHAF